MALSASKLIFFQLALKKSLFLLFMATFGMRFKFATTAFYTLAVSSHLFWEELALAFITLKMRVSSGQQSRR